MPIAAEPGGSQDGRRQRVRLSSVAWLLAGMLFGYAAALLAIPDEPRISDGVLLAGIGLMTLVVVRTTTRDGGQDADHEG